MKVASSSFRRYSIDMKPIEYYQKYLNMPQDEFNKLPMFKEDGSVAFYEVGDDLVGLTVLKNTIKIIRDGE